MAGDGFTGGWFRIRLESTTGYVVTLEFRIRRDTVELWCLNHCQAIMDRDLFRLWLMENPGPYVVDDVMWILKPNQPVWLLIRDSGWWSVPADDIGDLVTRV